MQVVDISDQSKTKVVGTLLTYQGAVDVKVLGNYLYIAELPGGIGGLRIVDVSDPTNPTERGLFRT